MPTFYDLFRECAERWPNNPCLEIQRREQVESYTYAEVRQMAESVGRWLTGQSLETGARAAILADNHPRWVAAYLGILAAGCTAVPLDTAFHADQVAKLLKDSGTSLIFCDEKHLKVTQEAINGLQVRIVRSSEDAGRGKHGEATLDAIFADGPGNFAPIEPSEGAVASLLYTSGTTADPKGVMLTHGNLFAEADSVFQVIKIGPEDSILGLLPLFHVLSQMANLLLPLVSGTRVVYLETLNTTELLRALQEREITIFCCRAAVLQPDSRPHLQRSRKKRCACFADSTLADEDQSGLAQGRHQSRQDVFRQSPQNLRPQNALSHHRRVALQS